MRGEKNNKYFAPENCLALQLDREKSELKISTLLPSSKFKDARLLILTPPDTIKSLSEI